MSLSLAEINRDDALAEKSDRNRELKQRYGISYTPFSGLESTPKKSWLVKNFLGANELSCLYGPPGSAKSLLAGDLAAHVAWGQDWMARPVTPGGVLFVAIERAALVMRRLAAFRQYHGIADLRWPSSQGRSTCAAAKPELPELSNARSGSRTIPNLRPGLSWSTLSAGRWPATMRTPVRQWVRLSPMSWLFRTPQKPTCCLRTINRTSRAA
jgi:hypothetical protein